MKRAYSILFIIFFSCADNMNLPHEKEKPYPKLENLVFNFGDNVEIIDSTYYWEAYNGQEYRKCTSSYKKEKIDEIVNSIDHCSDNILDKDKDVIMLIFFCSSSKDFKELSTKNVDALIICHTDRKNTPFMSIYESTESGLLAYSHQTFTFNSIFSTSLEYLLFEYFETEKHRTLITLKNQEVQFKNLNFKYQ